MVMMIMLDCLIDDEHEMGSERQLTSLIVIRMMMMMMMRMMMMMMMRVMMMVMRKMMIVMRMMMSDPSRKWFQSLLCRWEICSNLEDHH